MITILAGENYSPAALKIYKSLGKVNFWPDERTQVLVVRLDKVTQEVLNPLIDLRIIATSTTGLNHLDQEEIARKGYKLISLREERKFF